MALFLLTAWAMLRVCQRQTILPYLALGLYAIGTGMLTSLGCAGYGNHQAMAQRYMTTATLFWIALVLLALAAQVFAKRRVVRPGAVEITGLFAILTALSTFQGLDHFRWHYEFLSPARDELLLLGNNALLLWLYPDPQVVRDGATILKKYRLSVFR